MRQPDCESISGISVGRFRKTQKGAHHERYLILASSAAPDRGLFDSSRRIFKNRQSTFCGSEDSSASGSSEKNCGLVALHVNDRLERATIGFVFSNEFHSRSRIATKHDEERNELTLWIVPK